MFNSTTGMVPHGPAKKQEHNNHLKYGVMIISNGGGKNRLYYMTHWFKRKEISEQRMIFPKYNIEDFFICQAVLPVGQADVTVTRKTTLHEENVSDSHGETLSISSDKVL